MAPILWTLYTTVVKAFEVGYKVSQRLTNYTNWVINTVENVIEHNLYVIYD